MKNAVGLIMTGMGDDGFQGLLAMKTTGARTAAQDEDSCVVFGMPKAAAMARDSVHDVVPLLELTGYIMKTAFAPPSGDRRRLKTVSL